MTLALSMAGCALAALAGYSVGYVVGWRMGRDALRRRMPAEMRRDLAERGI